MRDNGYPSLSLLHHAKEPTGVFERSLRFSLKSLAAHEEKHQPCAYWTRSQACLGSAGSLSQRSSDFIFCASALGAEMFSLDLKRVLGILGARLGDLLFMLGSAHHRHDGSLDRFGQFQPSEDQPSQVGIDCSIENGVLRAECAGFCAAMGGKLSFSRVSLGWFDSRRLHSGAPESSGAPFCLSVPEDDASQGVGASPSSRSACPSASAADPVCPPKSPGMLTMC